MNISDVDGATLSIILPIFSNQWNAEGQVFYKIQIFVMVAFFVFVLQLGFRMKHIAYGVFRFLAWVSYLLVPVLLSYILGLLGHKGPTDFLQIKELRFATMYTASIWAVILLFAYAGFDNLTAFSVHEGRGRSKLVIQFFMQFVLIVLLLYTEKVLILPILFVFVVVCFKFMERLVSLGHACGATPRIKTDLTRVIEYMNRDNEEEGGALDPTTMRGFNYLVGPRYSTVDKDKRRILEGITLEKVWGCNEDDVDRRPWLLSPQGDPGGHLKDTCLSFSLFWLLLGKFRGYPLYKRNNNGSRKKAWKLVQDGLLAKDGGGGHERAFRVVDVELAFLRDYFHSKHIFFYLNGFRWKLTILAFPVMLWWFFQEFYSFLDKHAPKGKSIDLARLNYFSRVKSPVLIVAITILEVVQLLAFFLSRWFKVTLLCYYVKVKTHETSSSTCGFSRIRSYLLEKIGVLYRGSSWFPHWKRKLPQYSLVQSCTSLPKGPSFVQSVAAFLGIPLAKPGKKKGDNVKLSEQVQDAVVKSLKKMDGPRVSNKITSLKEGELDKKLSSACNLGLEKDAEIILVWHIATSFCELHPHSLKSLEKLRGDSGYKVATSLSKYCAYLLAFVPSLTSIPPLEAESICDSAIEEARAFFHRKRSMCNVVVEEAGGMINKLPCTSGNSTIEAERYRMMDGIELDEEEGDGAANKSVLQKGVILGKELTKRLGIDKGQGWDTLAGFWAEMILFLAQPNANEMDHAETLAEGGEFITHLWALLIHAGIDTRVEGLPTI